MQVLKRTGKKGESYMVRIRIHDYPAVTKTFSQKSEALRWGRLTEADLQAGRLGSPLSHQHTLGEAIRRYLEERPNYGGRWMFVNAKVKMLPWWEENFGCLKLADLTPLVMVRMRDRLSSVPSHPRRKGGERRRRSDATCNRYMSCLSTIFQCCVELWGWMESNPIRGIRRLSESTGRTRFLSDDEQEKLLQSCEADPELRDLVLLALLTAARRGELSNLRWRNVDLAGRTVTFMQTKNGHPRKIPLCAEAESLLHRRFRNRILGKSDWVFPSPLVDGPIDSISKRFRRVCNRAGILDFRFHDLRHSAASALARAGVPERQMMEVLGHRTAQMTRRYSHLRPSELRNAVQVLGAATRHIT